MISISLSPNVQTDDILLALKKVLTLSFLSKGGVEALEREFERRTGVQNAVAFNSGRSALLALLEAFGIGKGDEVLLQAFTCNAVPNPVLWAGARPVYVDCGEDWNMDAEDLERKITPKAKAVIVQHTFGKPADVERIGEVARRGGLLVIEDCAHALGAAFKGRQVGTFGDAAFFSFSRDKVISSVYGGMAATKLPEAALRLRKIQEGVGLPSPLWTLQQLIHPPLVAWVVLPTYSWLGKYLLVAFQSLRVLSKAVHKKEKAGEKPGYFPRAMPPALADLAVNQLGKLDGFAAHRREVALLFVEELRDTAFRVPEVERGHALLRLPVRHERAGEVLKNAFDQDLLLGDWYQSPVAPSDTNAALLGYVPGSCPKAEELARTTLNLPTHIRTGKKEVREAVAFLKEYGDS